MVSSVSPEAETANARVCGPTNAGDSYPLPTQMGTEARPTP